MNISEHIILFEQEMKRRQFSVQTIHNYSSCLKNFFGQSVKDHPKNINESDIRTFLGKFNESNTQRVYHSAIKKFYEICLGQKEKFKYIPYCRINRRYPIILSQSETQKLFDACDNIKHKAIMYVAYATGVRVSELLNIRLCNIDRANMVIHIMHGKGAKQRQVTMKPELLKIIETYWRVYRTKEYLFEGQNKGQYSAGSINQFLNKYALKAGIKKKVHIHLLRHLYATHSLEAGENLYVTQKVLGHSSPKTTADFYYHISPHIIANAYSPIQNLKGTHVATATVNEVKNSLTHKV